MNKLLMLLLLLVACTGQETRKPDYGLAYDRYVELRKDCARRGGNLVIVRRQYSGAKRGYTLMDLQGARCE